MYRKKKVMKTIILFGFCQTLQFLVFGQILPGSTTQIQKLERAENLKQIESLDSIFADHIILYTTELMPIVGKEKVISLYKYLFTRGNGEFAEYIVDTSYENKHGYVEQGKNISKRTNIPTDTTNFKAEFIKSNGRYIISELSIGKEKSLKKKIPELPKPTGKYQVGQTIRFYPANDSDNNRLLSFQIWYPTMLESAEQAVYQSDEVIKASSKFLNIPIFAIRYFSKMKSNSYLNTRAIPNQKFPILLYNHGYGGFTSVYQTVFEDLVSHGYIVVSIAHKNESALYLKGDGKVIPNKSENKFYVSRASELDGIEVGEFQNIILSSNDPKYLQEAYNKLFELSPLHNQSTRLWHSDTKAVYNKLKKLNLNDSVLAGLFDFKSVGIFGHSLGGATAGQFGFNSEIIHAGINLDGFQFGDLINSKLKIPFMFVSSNPEGNRYLRANNFMESSTKVCYQVVIKGFTHSSFTDLDYFLQGNDEMIDLQREVIRNFFDQYLKFKKGDIINLAGRYSNLTITRNKKR